jgi:uncharacterized small protein (DUF1192 family)
MQALIEDRLIATELEKTYGVQQLAAAVDGEVSAALAGSTQTTPQAITQLFGLSVEEFSEVILAPQARIELLQAELAKSNIDFDAWLTSALLKARVSIVVRDLGWRAGSVELTGVQSYTAEVKGIISQIASTTEAIQAAVSATTTVASSSASSTQ